MSPILPIVEIFLSIEGEGSSVGVPTVFVRLFNCNLRCTWCDTKYSYAPARPTAYLSIDEIVKKASDYGVESICLTGGEPLLYTERAKVLIEELVRIPHINDIHIETNGAIDLGPFAKDRSDKVRFIIDFKLPGSGEFEKMLYSNFELLNANDEIKFVIAHREDFELATSVLDEHRRLGQVLFSPVFEELPPKQLVEWMLERKVSNSRLSLQIHKVIWDPELKGV